MAGSENEIKSSDGNYKGLTYLVLLFLAGLAVAFLFLVAGNVVGAILSVSLGILPSIR